MGGIRPGFAGPFESRNPDDAPRASARKRQEGGPAGGTWVPPAIPSVVGADHVEDHRLLRERGLGLLTGGHPFGRPAAGRLVQLREPPGHLLHGLPLLHLSFHLFDSSSLICTKKAPPLLAGAGLALSLSSARGTPPP